MIDLSLSKTTKKLINFLLSLIERLFCIHFTTSQVYNEQTKKNEWRTNEKTKEQMNEWTKEQRNKQTIEEQMYEWMNEQMNEWMNEPKNECWMNEQTKGWMYKRMDEQTNEWTIGMNKWQRNKQTNEQMNII